MTVLLSLPLKCLRQDFNGSFSDLHDNLQTCDPLILVYIQEFSMRIRYLMVGSGTLGASGVKVSASQKSSPPGSP